ncbi:hypothetical protein DFJ58DRAFT_842439 [Suillus subalutaceus]|uniref:uncharacterized protein n=1 Tax=Suillus subalutaceus TaxID=48586 RepID=UPI001B86BD7C|nr:uncharacterized protein DFJ58DRAFT_842439 [Suillus subalutaceus]KAG1850363.1 hypothetical protein DFJ58DRAFT_842439 [Suillus subalutaceus]
MPGWWPALVTEIGSGDMVIPAPDDSVQQFNNGIKKTVLMTEIGLGDMVKPAWLTNLAWLTMPGWIIMPGWWPALVTEISSGDMVMLALVTEISSGDMVMLALVTEISSGDVVIPAPDDSIQQFNNHIQKTVLVTEIGLGDMVNTNKIVAILAVMSDSVPCTSISCSGWLVNHARLVTNENTVLSILVVMPELNMVNHTDLDQGSHISDSVQASPVSPTWATGQLHPGCLAGGNLAGTHSMTIFHVRGYRFYVVS